MKPRPDYQRRQAHRQRLALGRALHQVRRLAAYRRFTVGRRKMPPPTFRVPRIIRHHSALIRAAFFC